MALNLKLSREAENDLRDIYTHGARLFGYTQADAYSVQILAAFSLLAAFPNAHARLHPGTTTRTHVVGAHRILYDVERDHLLILRILHTRQLPPGLD